MAEIKIEKKNPMWPWVLVALLVLGVIIYFFVFDDNDGDMERETGTAVMTEEREDDTRERDAINNNTVAAYVDFVQEEDPEMGPDHEYSSEALNKLVDATEAMANEVGYEVGGDIQTVRENAQEIKQDPDAHVHANQIRRSAEILTNILENIQQAEFPALSGEASAVRSSAESIDPDMLTLDQKVEVKSFFDNAADLLEKMNN